MEPKEFIRILQSASFENVFNPYSDRCEIHDSEEAPIRRCDALLSLLTAATRAYIDSLWIGRDLGYRGGRRTGLALTDDVHINDLAARWGVQIERATVGPMMAERTAAVVWGVVRQIGKPIFLWNVFPFHPYEPGAPFTNRLHTKNERIVGEGLLFELLRILQPLRLVAIGNDAAIVAKRLAGPLEVIQVRHPSYGGQREFVTQVDGLYEFIKAGSPHSTQLRLLCHGEDRKWSSGRLTSGSDQQVRRRLTRKKQSPKW